jgi:hypothetical protein
MRGKACRRWYTSLKNKKEACANSIKSSSFALWERLCLMQYLQMGSYRWLTQKESEMESLRLFTT